MSSAEVVACGALGFFVGGAIWVIGGTRAMERPLLAGPACAGPDYRASVPVLA